MVAQYPVGGVAWDYLQYVIGLSQMGHDVIYHEDTWSWPYDPVRETASAVGDYSAGVLQRFFDSYWRRRLERNGITTICMKKVLGCPAKPLRRSGGDGGLIH